MSPTMLDLQTLQEMITSSHSLQKLSLGLFIASMFILISLVLILWILYKKMHIVQRKIIHQMVQESRQSLMSIFTAYYNDLDTLHQKVDMNLHNAIEISAYLEKSITTLMQENKRLLSDLQQCRNNEAILFKRIESFKRFSSKTNSSVTKKIQKEK
nr:hypothetical protein [Sulfurospirillum sp. 'SP']